MVKIFCPIDGCHKVDFGVPEPHQSHLNHHLFEAHNIKVTDSNIADFQKRQDAAWEEQYQLVETARFLQAKRIKEEFLAFQNDPSLPLPNESNGAINNEYVALMEVWDDDDDPEDKVAPIDDAQARVANEWFGSGPGYDVSFRHYQFQSAVEQDVARLLSTRTQLDVTPGLAPTRQGVGLPSDIPSADDSQRMSRTDEKAPEDGKPESLERSTESAERSTLPENRGRRIDQ